MEGEGDGAEERNVLDSEPQAARSPPEVIAQQKEA